MIRKLICVILASALLLAACSKRDDAANGEVSPPVQAVSEEAPSSEPPDIAVLSSESQTFDENSTEESGQGEDSYVPPQTMSITIPEGYTLPRIGMMLEEKGLCTVGEFIAACQEGDYSEYVLIAEQAPDGNRCFKLEGYLFPDTYEIYDSDKPDTIIRRILDNTAQRLGGDIHAKISQSGYTTDEILAMASIIEKEAFGKEQMPLISSVLHNRLDAGMKLQCDVTITYVEGAIKPFITGDPNRYNEHYNTYKCAGLPTGAICNPGIDAVKAALEPADTDYFYFVTDSDKNYYYAATWEEHEANVANAANTANANSVS